MGIMRQLSWLIWPTQKMLNFDLLFINKVIIMEAMSIAKNLFKEKIVNHPSNKQLIFKLIDSPEEAKRAFKLYS